MKGIKPNLDFAVVSLVIAGFVLIASQRLGSVPVPEGDEAFTLQVPYEMLNRGKLALPMLRYLGGNIDNAWHSYIPGYFVILSAFQKLFGFGLVQGRAFNLMTAALTLLATYLIGRRLFDWRAGLAAVVMLVGDQTFLERSRLLRDDYAAAALAMLAFYLYEMAEERKKARLYVASGLAAGAGVMCHTNMLYMIGAILLLILIRDGRRAFSSKKLYVFGTGAFAVMAYEIVYDVIDYKNFLLQNRGDDVHFRVFTSGGLWQNLVEERLRYLKWYAGGLIFPDLPQTTLRIFQLLTIAAIAYLVIAFARGIKQGNVLFDPRARLLVIIGATVMFHALIVSHKRGFYLVHIVPWFALGVGVMLRDGLDRVSRLRTAQWPRARFVYRSVVTFVVLASLGYTFQLVAQSRRYLAEVRSPGLASFDEFTAAIRDIVPEGLCPVAVKNPSIWLAFPEKDACFATIEGRMREDIDIQGKDYALITRPNSMPDVDYHLLGEMRNTPYGNLLIYYTGSDRRYLDLTPKRYQFFGELGGHDSIE